LIQGTKDVIHELSDVLVFTLQN